MALDNLGCPNAALGAAANTGKERFHGLEALFSGQRGIDYLSQRAGAGDAHQGAGRDQVGEIQAGIDSSFACCTTGVVPIAMSGSKVSMA